MMAHAEEFPCSRMLTRQAGAAFDICKKKCDRTGWDLHLASHVYDLL
jgi:hypothetical protein